MSQLMKSRTLTISIASPPTQVYAFASNPENLPRWATAFCKSVSNVDGEWIIETAVGPMGLRFCEENEFGVLDHTVRLPDGTEVLSPMRVLPNGEGSEVIFTLFHRPDVTEEQFAEDAKLVEQDLNTLKRVLEA